MRVAFVSPFANEADTDLSTMLQRYPLLEQLPRALAQRGHEVVVFINANVAERVIEHGVIWQVIPAPWWSRQLARGMHRWKGAYGPAYYRINPNLSSALRRLQPDVIHVSGLTMDLHLAHLARTAARTGAPLIAHYHGGLPAAGRLARLQRWNGRRLAAVCFTTSEQATAWQDAGVLVDPRQVALVLETSSPFSAMARDLARAQSGMSGDPIYLCAGRLHPIKDPLTVLRGFALIAEQQPEARLYLAYLTNELLPDVTQWLAIHPLVAARVTLLGRVPAADMQALYASADILLQASQREWSGLALLEAMSCGCIPLVTDIPSFRRMTAGGTIGRLFPIGDAAALARAALELDADQRARLSQEVRQHFRQHLSFAAMARDLEVLYARLTTPR